LQTFLKNRSIQVKHTENKMSSFFSVTIQLFATRPKYVMREVLPGE